MENTNNIFDFSMVKVLIFNSAAILLSIIPYLEESLRIGTLAATFFYTVYKIYKEKKKK